MEKIKTLIVDDSAVVRQALSDILRSDPAIELMNPASDPIFAMQRMKKQWPDVIILDIQMPRMDGVTFLRKIMAERPTPVIVCSTLTGKGAETTIQVLSAGAVEAIAKPKIDLKGFLYETKMVLIDTVKAAAKANLSKFKRNAELTASLEKSRTSPLPAKPAPPPERNIPKSAAEKTQKEGFSVAPKLSADAMLAPPGSRPRSFALTEAVVGIGASTGGTQALEVVLKSLPPNAPGVVIVQHMPAGFTAAFAQRLNGVCSIEVKEAENNDCVKAGRALIAPGDKHMLLRRGGGKYFVEVKGGPVINRHRPSVDILFRSMSQSAGSNAVGIIMTGMGDDGARGLEEMHNAGAFTIAQNEETCVVFGMPKEAIKRRAADKILALEEISNALLKRRM